MIKQLLQAIIDRINTCRHEWELIHKTDCYWDDRSKYPMFTKWTYRCIKCCKSKTISNE